MPTQLHFIVNKWKEQLATDPSLAEHQPYEAVAAGDLAWLGAAIDKHYAGDDTDLRIVIGAILGITADRTVHDYTAEVSEFYETQHHLSLGRPYRQAVYEPMVELLRYLEANGFTPYIVSGGGRDFMRPMSSGYYGIPPERVIGSAVGLQYIESEAGRGTSCTARTSRSSTMDRRSRFASGAASAADRSWPEAATPTATSRCCGSCRSTRAT